MRPMRKHQYMNDIQPAVRELLPLGVMTSLDHHSPLEALTQVREMGFPTCQLGNPPAEYIAGPRSAELTAELRAAVRETGIHITAVFIMFPGHVWDLVDGPRTIGLVPTDTRAERVVHACRMSDWAREAGISEVATHIGFIPEDPNDPTYLPFLRMMRAYCGFVKDNGQTFAFETGQETALTLKRTIEDIGMDNVGVNLDPANLLLYGKDQPLNAVELIGKYVVNTHCKDGSWPISFGLMGEEKPLGAGEVNFPALITRLYGIGYRGPLTIEREIEGDQQVADITRAKELLEEIRAGLVTNVVVAQ